MSSGAALQMSSPASGSQPARPKSRPPENSSTAPTLIGNLFPARSERLELRPAGFYDLSVSLSLSLRPHGSGATSPKPLLGRPSEQQIGRSAQQSGTGRFKLWGRPPELISRRSLSAGESKTINHIAITQPVGRPPTAGRHAPCRRRHSSARFMGSSKHSISRHFPKPPKAAIGCSRASPPPLGPLHAPISARRKWPPARGRSVAVALRSSCH